MKLWRASAGPALFALLSSNAWAAISAACTAGYGENCVSTGCCALPELRCFRKNAGWAACKQACVPGIDPFDDKAHQTPWSCELVPPPAIHEGLVFDLKKTNKGKCEPRWAAPGAPANGIEHNGVHLPDACFPGPGPHHVFVIGDWGGVLPGQQGNELGTRPVPADHTKLIFAKHREFVSGVDDWAQQRVAEQMKKRAVVSKPDYILNAGDNLYWGGLSTHCGGPVFQGADFRAFVEVFENIYNGPGLDGKQWLGVLGNHDYGGWMFTGGWDHSIGYTWGGAGSSGRWLTPAQYWSAKAVYPDDKFSVDYFFLDTNVWDAHVPENPSAHNICSLLHNTDRPSCGPQGPKDPWDCPGWFRRLWEDGKGWLQAVLAQSTADWQVVVTHFPPSWGHWDWAAMAKWYGIDLIVSGHKHQQEVHYLAGAPAEYWPGLSEDFLSPTAWIVAGGGGGVTSEELPDRAGNDDQYGFMDLVFSKEAIKIDAISHGGIVRSSTWVKPRPRAVPFPNRPGMPKVDLPASKPTTDCDSRNGTYEFYMYRAQDDQEYANENINAASLAGVLWYLHHEVVMECPRKFGITRIRRLKVTIRNTCDLWKAKGTHFGPFVPFDSGKCHVAGCDNYWNQYGAVVGCQHIPYNSGIFAAYCTPPTCRYAHWYSLPGACPSAPIGQKTPACEAQQPGGSCAAPTGERGCTFHAEDAGEVRLDELYALVPPMPAFCAGGRLEYNNQTDHGMGVSFWDGIYKPSNCMWRLEFIRKKFKEKYPGMPDWLEEPRCDFFETDPKDYLVRTGSGFPRPISV